MAKNHIGILTENSRSIRSLFKDVPPGVTDDFTISTHSIREGYRLVFDNEAIASEASDGKIEKELQRKIRIMTRGLRAVLISRDLLNPVKHGFYSIQLFSHKVMRRTAIIPLIILLVISPWHQSSGQDLCDNRVYRMPLFYGCRVVCRDATHLGLAS